MPSLGRRRARAAGLMPLLAIASIAVLAIQFVPFGHPSASARGAAAGVAHRPGLQASGWRAPASTTTSTTTTTTTAPPVPAAQDPAPAPPPPTTTTTTTLPPPAAPAPAPATALPAEGTATAWGCAAAEAYLAAYAAPGFSVQCPGDALGREAMTCVYEPGACPGEEVITIAEPCPAAYMNEASNSWVVLGESTAPIDPYGTC